MTRLAKASVPGVVIAAVAGALLVGPPNPYTIGALVVAAFALGYAVRASRR
jgi:hypothetical protein